MSFQCVPSQLGSSYLFSVAQSGTRIEQWQVGAQVVLHTASQLSERSPITRSEEEWGVPTILKKLSCDDRVRDVLSMVLTCPHPRTFTDGQTV
jgi:hypothetical protein